MGIKRSQTFDLIKTELEDSLIENTPYIRKKISKAEEDLKAGRVISLDEYLSTQEK